MYLERRLIAMMDVLGFANRLNSRESLESTLAKYSELIARANGHMFNPRPMQGSPGKPPANFAYGKFVFDTVVLVSPPLNIKSVYHFTFATVLLMELFFADEFPLRGAIGIGDLCADEGNSVFLSDRFKSLRREEENQQWAGCCLLPEAEQIVLDAIFGELPPDLSSVTPLRSAALHRYRMPTKNGLTAERWCLNWSYLMRQADLNLGLSFMGGDEAKHRNTVRYLDWLAKLSDDAQALKPEFSPAVRMRTMKARSGMRVAFTDKNDDFVNPGCQYSIQMIGSIPGESAGVVIQPPTTA